MIYCLVGHSSSGKSSIEKGLNEIGYQSIVNYTTRPMREGEEDGVDYRFLKEEEFVELCKLGYFVEVSQFREWFYATSLEDVGYTEEDYIIVTSLKGFSGVLKEVGDENIRLIFIKSSERERVQRLLNRGDDIDEIFRRIKSDRVDFYDAEMVSDYTVENKDLQESVGLIQSIIMNERKKHKGESND